MFNFFVSYCVVVSTYSIIVYVYAKIEYVSVRTYPSQNRIRTLRVLESWLKLGALLHSGSGVQRSHHNRFTGRGLRSKPRLGAHIVTDPLRFKETWTPLRSTRGTLRGQSRKGERWKDFDPPHSKHLQRSMVALLYSRPVINWSFLKTAFSLPNNICNFL